MENSDNLDREEDNPVIEKLMDQIESHEFAAVLNIASSFKVFWRTAYEQPVAKQLIKEIQDCPENMWLVFKKLLYLSGDKIDLEYENPWDTALGVYLGTLSFVNLEMAEAAAEFVVEIDNGWWATKFANYLLRSRGAGMERSL